MKQKKYNDYLWSNLNKGATVIAFISAIGIGLWQDWKISLIVLFTIIIFSLFFTSKQIFNDQSNIYEEYKMLQKKNEELHREKNEVKEKFDNQSKEYSESIEEKNAYKGIVLIVDSVVYGRKYRSQETNELVQMLKYSIETQIKRNDENGDI